MLFVAHRWLSDYSGAMTVTIQQIEEARTRIRDGIYESPCAHSQTFSRLVNNKAYFKLENLQMTGSFKERGALNCLRLLDAEARQRGVVAASAGNHAQGVAYHATQLGIAARIVMPIGTPLNKITSTQQYGAQVVLKGNDYDEAFAEALRISEDQGLSLIHAFDNADIIAGQGTLGLELIEQNPFLEAVLLPIGGGGLCGGVACALKETNPKITVIGVQTSRMPSMREAISEGKPVTLAAAATIAEGINVRRCGELTLPLIQRYVDEIVTVDEEEIANAILYLLEKEKTVAEGAGAVTAAALLHQRTTLRNKRIAVLVSGGNIDVNFLSRIIERGLTKDGRVVRLHVQIKDFPGALHLLTGVVARQQANIMDLTHDRIHRRVGLGETDVIMKLQTRGTEHVNELIAALRAAGYTVVDDG